VDQTRAYRQSLLDRKENDKSWPWVWNVPTCAIEPKLKDKAYQMAKELIQHGLGTGRSRLVAPFRTYQTLTNRLGDGKYGAVSS